MPYWLWYDIKSPLYSYTFKDMRFKFLVLSCEGREGKIDDIVSYFMSCYRSISSTHKKACYIKVLANITLVSKNNFFETGSHYVPQAGLKLTTQTNSRSSYLYFPSTWGYGSPVSPPQLQINFFFPFTWWDWGLNQNFALAKQTLYCLSHTSSSFCSGYLRDGVLRPICLAWPQTTILPISASQVS
jgi:hypothetical protein